MYSTQGTYLKETMFSSPPNSSSHYSVDPLPFLLSDFMINIPSSPFSPLDNYSSTSIFLKPLINMENHTTSMVDDVSKAKKKAPPRKRLSKKDRHSKIYTAKGLRDRRMRLSLDVARKFFDLQDILGFDKASETVLWLLKQSESSIEQVKKTLIGNHEAIITKNMIDCKSATSRSSSSPSITSECNVAYDMLDGSLSRNIINSRVSGSSSSSSRARKNVDPSIVRESRKMARARAKERTMEKMWIQSLNNGRSHVEESQLGQRLLKPSMEEDAIAKQLLIGLGDQEHVVSGGHPQEHLYRDLQLLSKPWEAFNGPSYI